MSKVLKKKRKAKDTSNLQGFEQAAENSIADPQNSAQQNQLKSLQKHEGQKQLKVNETGTQHKLKPMQQQTVGGQSVDESLPRPYQFLKFANPPLHTIFVPHFALKTLTFGLTLIFIVCFVVLLIYSYTKPHQNKLSWNCSIFQLQNKYYPRMRYGYQFWRVPVSFFFHSNIAHFVLNVIGLQIYGYFVQWYYGKVKYVITLVLAGILAFFLSCVSLPTSVSTTSSAFLFAIMALKIYFLYEYKDYKPLLTRRILIYLLFLLILGINIIPILVNNNVDFTNHIGGLGTGLLLGLFYHINKTYPEQTKCQKALKFLSLALIIITIIICIALMYALPDTNGNYLALNQNIDIKCADTTQE